MFVRISKLVFVITFFFIFKFYNVDAAMVEFDLLGTVNKRNIADVGGGSDHKDFGIAGGVEFNNDGTKMFVSFANRACQLGNQQDNCGLGADGFEYRYFIINTYNLSTPFNTSTASYAGDSERCILNEVADSVYDLEFSNDGKMLFVASRSSTDNDEEADNVHRYDLNSPFDLSNCQHMSDTINLDSTTLTNGSLAGDFDHAGQNNLRHRLQGVEINDDGTKLFLAFMDNSNNITIEHGTRIFEYKFSTPYDLTTISLVKTAGIPIPHHNIEDFGTTNVGSIKFSSNGKRLFVVDHNPQGVTQITLEKAFDTSVFQIDGKIRVNTGFTADNNQPRGITFSPTGNTMYLTKDRSGGDNSTIDQIFQYTLACPFNIIDGKCPGVEEDKARMAMAEANIDLARRTIDYSTKSALNRLKWIKRNKDRQNLSNLNMNLNFTNPILNNLYQGLSSNLKYAKTASNKKNNNQEDIFYWSEGSVALGRAGETNLALSKDLRVYSFTYGFDKFTDNDGISGLAIRYGTDDVNIGSTGNRIDSNTLNFSYYHSNNLKDQSTFLDTVFGIGLIESDLLTIIEDDELTGENRLGKQIYATIKASEHYKKQNFTLIPSGQLDLGHTIFDDYYEKIKNSNEVIGIKAKEQKINTGNVRLGLAAMIEENYDKSSSNYFGKLEYQSPIIQKSDFEYSYQRAPETTYLTKVQTNADHILNTEIGLDINTEKFKYFLIYERSQAIDYGLTEQLYFSYGYLPNKNSEYTFQIEGLDSLANTLTYEKKLDNLNLLLSLKNNLSNFLDYEEVAVILNSEF